MSEDASMLEDNYDDLEESSVSQNQWSDQVQVYFKKNNPRTSGVTKCEEEWLTNTHPTGSFQPTSMMIKIALGDKMRQIAWFDSEDNPNGWRSVYYEDCFSTREKKIHHLKLLRERWADEMNWLMVFTKDGIRRYPPRWHPYYSWEHVSHDYHQVFHGPNCIMTLSSIPYEYRSAPLNNPAWPKSTPRIPQRSTLLSKAIRKVLFCSRCGLREGIFKCPNQKLR